MLTPVFMASQALAQAAPVDVALQQHGGTATASSYGTYVGDPQYPWKAIDGDPQTGWSSNFEIPAWLKVEFAQVYRIEEIAVLWGSHVHDYTVELSIDGATWTTVLGPATSQNFEAGPSVYESFPITPRDAKFIRMNLLTTSAPSGHIFQASIQDLQAYSSVTPTVTVPLVTNPPIVIDGAIAGNEWMEAWTSVETFVSGGSDAPIYSEIRLLHDGSFLYVAMATTLSAGWDSKGRLRIDGDNSMSLNGNPIAPYVDIQSEVGAPGSWSGYTNYQALTGPGQSTDVLPGAGESRASAGQGAVSYEFKVPLSDLNVASGSTIRLILTASPNATQMWHWPIYDLGPEHPALWAELTLADSCAVQNYCLAGMNSNGTTAMIGSNGQTSIAANNFQLNVSGASPNRFGMFFYGASQQAVLYGDGMLCVGPNIRRIPPVLLTDALGDVGLQLDFALPPFSSGSHAIGPNSTWNFQFWYRDPMGGPAGFNFSDGLQATFCP
jgi:hypothetical protein